MDHPAQNLPAEGELGLAPLARETGHKNRLDQLRRQDLIPQKVHRQAEGFILVLQHPAVRSRLLDQHQ